MRIRTIGQALIGLGQGGVGCESHAEQQWQLENKGPDESAGKGLVWEGLEQEATSGEKALLREALKAW